MQNDNNAKILQIVQDRGSEIYLKKTFIGLVLDYFPNDDFGRLLKKTIENKGAVYVSELKDYPADEIQVNYIKILDKLEKESFIAKEVLAPAVELLCFGLGYSVTSPATTPPATQAPPPPTTQTPPPPPPTTQAPPPPAATQAPPAPTQASPLSDFEIENGVLRRYIGRASVVTIPNSVTSIGNRAFYQCTSLGEITIPNSVTSIGVWAFKGCTSLSEVTIPDSITYIGDCAFCECYSLSKVTIPDSITEIGESAFYGCDNLPEDVEEQIEQINPEAFETPDI